MSARWVIPVQKIASWKVKPNYKKLKGKTSERILVAAVTALASQRHSWHPV